MLSSGVNIMARFLNWLERRWIAPAYVGWVLLGLALFFFAAATNTLAGWLYVMSGVLLAMLAIAAVLPPRHLYKLMLQRQPLSPVSAGETLLVELALTNQHHRPKGLFQVIDQLPSGLGAVQQTAISQIAPGQTQVWRYSLPTMKRGVYSWSRVDLRTAAPLGLFWCRRSIQVPGSVVVYPHIFPLTRCPILETTGQETGYDWHQHRTSNAATEGITRTLRPYRWGDPPRLIHWRTSARYGELRVRELETVISGHRLIIALDSSAPWSEVNFEQAVVGAASLYIYALQQGYTAMLWTAAQGTMTDKMSALSALALVQFGPQTATTLPLNSPVLWLTTDPQVAPQRLPPGSQIICWRSASLALISDAAHPIHWINPDAPLGPQLQTLG